MKRGVLACVVLAAGILTSSFGLRAQVTQRMFASPDDAVKALFEVVKKGNVDELITLFGQEGKDLLDTSDPATARMNRQTFAIAAREQWHLADEPPDRKRLVIGNENWPFPVPIVKKGAEWHFDTAAGREEIIARRIGRNELAALDTVRAYVSAQRRYAAEAHDGFDKGAYAVKFQSDPGKQNGLYWPVTKGQKRSPLGDLVAQAAEDGRAVGGGNGGPSPYEGYYYKILTAQGASAAGGAKAYVLKGRMTGGFALVAWPAEYDVTGVMSFIVNQDGKILEKDLGPNTHAVASKITAFNPDSSWKASQ